MHIYIVEETEGKWPALRLCDDKGKGTIYVNRIIYSIVILRAMCFKKLSLASPHENDVLIVHVTQKDGGLHGQVMKTESMARK